jgi:hypothetical protein
MVPPQSQPQILSDMLGAGGYLIAGNGVVTVALEHQPPTLRGISASPRLATHQGQVLGCE